MGTLSSTSDTTGPSKLKFGLPVPDTEPTVTVAARNKSASAFDRHDSVVADTHDPVRHDPRSPPPPRSNPNVDDWSAAPKPRPETVTDAYPDSGAFNHTLDATAESKVKIGFPVPDTDATVTVMLPKMSPNAFERHASVVADVHDDVKHTPRSRPPPRSSPAVAVCSPTPKSSPDTVTDAYPV